jgi:hypothetical protein
MSTTMGAAISRDGGRTRVGINVAGQESGVPDNGDVGGQFSFISQTDGWLLWQTEALLRTVDGVHWTVRAHRK